MPSTRPIPKERLSGFALLITITLMAFLVLLLVSLASLTRVETQVASNSWQISSARQNALMALNIALGRLQAAAGPDQRITATAGIVSGADVSKLRWTGVWNTATASPSPEWLVSTASGTPATGVAEVASALPAGGTVTLVGANTTDSAPGNVVSVETQSITGSVTGITGTPVIGNFAYWVGDEGVKAKVSLTDPGASPSATVEEKSYRLKMAQRSGIERMDESTAGTALSSNYPANADNLPKVLDLHQLPLTNTSGQSALTNAVKNRYHDLTASSCSVLADVSKGGLKKDLTSWLAHASLAGGAPADTDFMAPLDSADATGFTMPRWGLLRSYAGLVAAGTPLAPRVQNDQQTGFHPLISYFRVAFGVSCAGVGQPMYAHMFPVLVLWNPYDTPIDASTYEFVFGLRYNANNIAYTSNGTVKGRLLLSSSPWLSANNDTNTPDGAQSARHYTRLLLNSPVIQPGQSLVFTLDQSGWYYTPGTNANAIAMSPNSPPATDNSLYFALPAVTLTATDWANVAANQFKIVISGGELDMALYPPQLASPNLTVANWRQLTPYHLVQHFGLTSRTQVVTVPNDPEDAAPGPHYWQRLPITDALNNQFYRDARWLANLNPLAPLHMLAAGSPGLNQVYLNDSTNAPPAPDIFDGNQVSAGYYKSPVPSKTLQVSELPHASTAPEGRFLSLAQLQQVTFSKLAQNPAYAVGNSEVNYLVGLTASSALITPTATNPTPANLINRVYDLSYLLNQALWDRYYFSTIPQSISDAQVGSDTFHLPNARNTFYRKNGVAPVAADLIGTEAFNTASARLLLNGGFNVNSTSEQAWRALLASHNNVDTSGTKTHPFSRFAGTRIGDASNQTLTSGYRILSDAQINALARNIVSEVKNRGPFLSLAAFINRRLTADAFGYQGPLQAAINATDTGATAADRINDLSPFNDSVYQIGDQSYYPNSTATEDQKKLHLGSSEASAIAKTRPSGSRAAFMPGFLTQADLLNSLGPVLTARSDTFVIRAYGDVQNPATTTVEGKAWCEAVVQRLPDYVEDGVNAWAVPAANSDSEKFGRRFKIVSFRWLAASDI
jgi:hypothetical protein